MARIIQNKEGETTHIYGEKKYKNYLENGWELIATVWGWNLSFTHEKEADDYV